MRKQSANLILLSSAISANEIIEKVGNLHFEIWEMPTCTHHSPEYHGVMSETRVHLSKTEPEAYQALDAFSRTVGRICTENGIDERLKELVMIHCSQLNGCAFCVRIHIDRALAAGVDIDTLTQISTWRESGVFSDRERAALELAEAFTFISEEGVSDEVYDTVGSVFTEKEYAALSWACVSINAFNRIVIAGRYPVPARSAQTSA